MNFKMTTNVLLVVVFINIVKASVLRPNGYYYYSKINDDWEKPINEDKPKVIIEVINIDKSEPELPGDDLLYETDNQNHKEQQPMDIKKYFNQFKNRKSKEKCVEYVHKLKEDENKEETYSQRIVGGRYSKAGEFPHMGALGYRINNSRELSFDCSSFLISEEFLVTAKHCVNKQGPVVVRLGVEKIKNIKKNRERKPTDVNIKKIIPHCKKDVDLALIQLERKLNFTKFIRPACMLMGGEKTKSALIAGWGKNVTDPTSHITSIRLKMAEVDLIPMKECEKLYKLKRNWTMLVKGKICAHKRDHKTNTTVADTCEGDSGSPLQVKMNTETSTPMYNVIGVTARGNPQCATKFPALYTDVTQVLPWIEKHVWMKNVGEDCYLQKCQNIKTRRRRQRCQRVCDRWQRRSRLYLHRPIARCRRTQEQILINII